ncbi:MAG: helicase associated domain-containing protein, partial [Bacteroidota bacterium]
MRQGIKMGIDAKDTFWKENIVKLKRYYAEHGDYFVPPNWKQDRKLATWTENIRKHPKRLPAKRLKELKKLGFVFDMPKDWNGMFLRLEQFFETYGHSFVPSNQKGLEDLFDWTVTQRKARRILSARQIDHLDSVQFEWDELKDDDLRWEFHYGELLDFKKEHGHTNVPEGYKRNQVLAGWVSRQRSKYKKGELSKERIRRLEGIGFLLRYRDQNWENRFKELVAYKREHRHLDRFQIRRDNYTLGLWIHTQLSRIGTMSDYRKKKLTTLGLKLEKGDTYSERWNAMFEKLKAFVKEHGHFSVSRKYDYRLMVWISRNRALKAKGNLSKERIKKLEGLGFKWRHETFADLWKTGYAKLVAFKKKHGHTNVPKHDVELYEWLQAKKKGKREGTLRRDREEILSKLGVLWSGEFEKKKMERWNEMFQKFKALKEKYQDKYHLKLRQLPELRYWVNRQSHNKSKLSAVKKKMLDGIQFPWHRTGNLNDELWDVQYQKLLSFKKKYGHC